ncbi:MAG: hypothetical protein FWD15_03430 [Alphaproteobacteria bacterium]|nr:hypothetical protein [Alphaproteobacteria bacterium]
MLIGLLITSLIVARAFSVKSGTRTLDSEAITLSSSLFLVVIIWAMWPIMGADASFNGLSPITLIAGMAKGAFIYYGLKLGTDVARESNSAANFRGFIAISIAAPINAIFLGDNITAIQVLSCIGLGALGLAFFFRGAASELSRKGKIFFAGATLIQAACPVADQIGIPPSNWYMYILISMNTAFAFSVIAYRKMLGEAVAGFRLPIMWAIGALFAISELVVIYSAGNILGPSLTGTFFVLSAPIIMIGSAYLHSERTPREQLLFGVLAFVIALPIILG